uniref:Uncharacterized protein n=1 Tax=CrAss-like virus sp. ctUXy6 TaxID=2825835 RepID=A0A8S5V7E8_9CAUD|nr:MAG TPA: hypothetical protein [CrAss-like virus sp. ctUXy6]
MDGLLLLVKVVVAFFVYIDKSLHPLRGAESSCMGFCLIFDRLFTVTIFVVWWAAYVGLRACLANSELEYR